jgi:hypothetical protein
MGHRRGCCGDIGSGADIVSELVATSNTDIEIAGA